MAIPQSYSPEPPPRIWSVGETRTNPPPLSPVRHGPNHRVDPSTDQLGNVSPPPLHLIRRLPLTILPLDPAVRAAPVITADSAGEMDNMLTIHLNSAMIYI